MLTPEREAGLRAYIEKHGEENIMLIARAEMEAMMAVMSAALKVAYVWRDHAVSSDKKVVRHLTNPIAELGRNLAACEAAGVKIEAKAGPEVIVLHPDPKAEPKYFMTLATKTKPEG